MRELAAEYEGRVVVARVNANRNMKLARRYDIRAIPTTLIFYKGQVQDRLLGNQPKSVLTAKLNALLK